jgi:LuxR family maltose regulon positive regulatory protein
LSHAELPKVSPPRLDRVAPRPRVAAVLGEAARRAAVWVQAPGGSGKTTAVAAFAAGARRPVAWMHLDGGDAKPQTFFHFLALAAQRARRKGSPPLPAWAPELDAELALFARRFARALLESAPAAGFTLVLDNAQDIPTASTVHEAIAALGEELAPNAAVFVMSREAPCAAYSGLLGRGRLEIVPPGQLAFTEAELKEVLRNRGILDESRLAALWRQSNGWIAGALLLAMQSGIAEASGDPRSEGALVFGYFATQLLARLPAEDRHLLLRTAFLRTIPVAGAARLAGDAAAGERLARLASEGLFTTRLSSGEPRFRYHDLLREFLQEEAARAMEEGELRELKRATAGEMVAVGEPLPALELLAGIASWDEFGRVAVAQAERLMDQGHAGALARLVEAVPAERRAADPWLAYWLGQCQLGTSDDDAFANLKAAHALFAARGDAAGQLVAAIDIPSTILNQLNSNAEYDEWLARIEALVDAVDELPTPWLRLKVLGGLVGAILQSRLLEARTDTLVRRLLALVPQVGDANLRLQALTHVASLAWRYRRTDLAPPIIEMVAREGLEERASPLLVLHWLYDIITYDSMYGSTARALACGERAERVAAATGLPQAEFEALLLRMEAVCDCNDTGLARELLSRLERHADPARPFSRVAVHAFRARIALLEGDAKLARGEGAAAISLLDGVGTPMGLRSAYWMIECGALALDGAWDEALACGERYRPHFKPHNQRIVDVFAAWIEAARALAAGAGDARDRLAAAVAAAKAENYHLFLRHANAVASRLCAQAIAWDIEPAFVAAAIARRRLAPPEPDTPQWPWPVRVRTLGGFEVEVAGSAEPPLARQQKPAQLLQALIALGGRGVPAAKLVELLWPGEGRVGAQQAFDTTLHRLRKALGADSALVYEDRQLGLDRAQAWVDALSVDARLESLEARIEAGAAPGEIAAALRPITALYRGHFLPGAGDAPWAAQARDRLWSRLRRAMLAYAQAAARDGDTEHALQTYFFVADQDPLAEDAFFGLMVTYSSRGQNAEALRAYERCVLALHAQLGTAPSERLRTLAAALRATPH